MIDLKLVVDAQKRQLRRERVALDTALEDYQKGLRPHIIMRLAREHVGITQKHLALELGVSRSAILQIERGIYMSEHVYDAAMEYLCRLIQS